MKKETLFSLGGIITAILATACCIGPFIVVVLGIGTATAFSKFEAYRPYFMLITIVIWGVAFYKLYLKPDDCKEGDICSMPQFKQKQRLLFWIATVLIVGIVTFPYWIGLV